MLIYTWCIGCPNVLCFGLCLFLISNIGILLPLLIFLFLFFFSVLPWRSGQFMATKRINTGYLALKLCASFTCVILFQVSIFVCPHLLWPFLTSFLWCQEGTLISPWLWLFLWIQNKISIFTKLQSFFDLWPKTPSFYGSFSLLGLGAGLQSTRFFWIFLFLWLYCYLFPLDLIAAPFFFVFFPMTYWQAGQDNDSESSQQSFVVGLSSFLLLQLVPEASILM